MQKSMKTSMMILFSLFIVLGLAMIAWHGTALLVICYVLGAGCAIFGLFRTVMYFTKNSENERAEVALALGVLLIMLGMVLIFAAKSVAAVFGICAGIAIIISSIINVRVATKLDKPQNSVRNIILGASVFMFIVGALLIFVRFDSTKAAASVCIGLALLLEGGIGIYSMINAS